MSTTSAVEEAVWIDAAGERIFGVHSRPSAASSVGVVLVHSGVHTMSANTGRIWTRTARLLALNGIPSLRLDMAGSGNSTGFFERRGDGQPVADVVASVEFLVRRGARRVLVVGHCFGAVPAIASAQVLDQVRSLILVAPPIAWIGSGQTVIRTAPVRSVGGAARSLLSASVLKRVFSDTAYRRWLLHKSVLRLTAVSQRGGRTAEHPNGTRKLMGLEELDQLSRQGVGVRLLYGHDDDLFAGFERVRGDGFENVLARPSVRLEVWPGHLHNLDRVVAQDRLSDFISAEAALLAGVP